MLSKHTISYLNGLYSELTHLDSIKEQIPTEKIINYLGRKKFKHLLSFHDGKHNELLNICDNPCKTQRMD